MKAILTVLAFLAIACSEEIRNSREFLQGKFPFLGTYWESYLTYQTRPETCLDLTTYDPPEHADDFGYNIANAPSEVQVVYIAFGHTKAEECKRGDLEACEPYVCGLHLYGIAGINDDVYSNLKRDIATMKSRGQVVKLAYGGDEYGNIGPFNPSFNIYTSYFNNLIDQMVHAVNDLGLDGVEIVNQEGCGASYFVESCAAQIGYQLHFIERWVKRIYFMSTHNKEEVYFFM